MANKCISDTAHVGVDLLSRVVTQIILIDPHRDHCHSAFKQKLLARSENCDRVQSMCFWRGTQVKVGLWLFAECWSFRKTDTHNHTESRITSGSVRAALTSLFPEIPEMNTLTTIFRRDSLSSQRQLQIPLAVNFTTTREIRSSLSVSCCLLSCFATPWFWGKVRVSADCRAEPRTAAVERRRRCRRLARPSRRAVFRMDLLEVYGFPTGASSNTLSAARFNVIFCNPPFVETPRRPLSNSAAALFVVCIVDPHWP